MLTYCLKCKKKKQKKNNNNNNSNTDAKMIKTKTGRLA